MSQIGITFEFSYHPQTSLDGPNKGPSDLDSSFSSTQVFFQKIKNFEFLHWKFSLINPN
jgi:hypothetical protein